MPSLSKDHTIIATSTLEILTLPLDFQVLKAASIFALEDNITTGDCYATLGILAGGTTIQNQVAALAAGYIGTLGPLSWSGSIPVEHDYYLFAQLLGQAGDTFRLSCILWKIRLDEKGEFRADP